MPRQSREARIRARAASSELKDRTWAIRQPDCPSDVLVSLFRAPVRYEGWRAVLHPNFPIDVLVSLVDADDNRLDYSGVWRTAAFTPEVVSRTIDRRLRLGQEHRLEGPLSCPQCPARLLTRFSGSSNQRLVRRVAENPSTPPEDLIWLAGSGVSRVREGVARNPAAPAEALEVLLSDSSNLVLRALLNRKDEWSARVVDRAANSRSTEVRKVLARTTDDPELLDRLAYDSAGIVRRRVRENSNSSEYAQVVTTLFNG